MTLLKTTTTQCPICFRACVGEVHRVGQGHGQVVLRRQCPEHGEFEATLASDARFYWLSKGQENGCGAGGGCCAPASEEGRAGTLGRNAGRPDVIEKLSTCLALIEIVDSCNLACPTCFADSPVGAGERVKARPLEELQARIEGVIQRKGKIEILQLSGGEPTLHPRLLELLGWAQAHPKIDMTLINTNGLRIVQDDALRKGLAEAARRKGLQFYLQFDGIQESGQRWLRGADLRAMRERVIECCADINLPITLAMTVIPDNLPHVWDAIAFGLERPIVHGITFQPLFGSGRVPTDPQQRLNAADVILSAIEGSRGKLGLEDFTPLPCGDPNCAIIGYLLRMDGQTRSLSEFVDFGRLQGFLHDRVNYRIEELAQCGCENEPLGQLLHGLETQAPMPFRIMVKPFMDAWTWDQDRIDRCCTHVIRPDGKLDSFCRYYGAPMSAASPPPERPAWLVR